MRLSKTVLKNVAKVCGFAYLTQEHYKKDKWWDMGCGIGSDNGLLYELKARLRKKGYMFLTKWDSLTHTHAWIAKIWPPHTCGYANSATSKHSELDALIRAIAQTEDGK